MRGLLIRTVIAVSLAVAVLVPNLSGTAQAIPAYTKTECSPSLLINGRHVATCGQTRGTEGRHGSYDVASRTYFWGSWRPRYYGQLQYPNSFVGFPALVDSAGAGYVVGTIYRPARDSDDHRYEGRRGIFRSSGVFVPTTGWHESVCLPPLRCPHPDWQYEPVPPPPTR